MNQPYDGFRAPGRGLGRTIGAEFAASAARHGARTALVDGETRLSYQQLAARSDALAENLRGLGLALGDSMLIAMPNCWEYVVLVLACLRAGITPALMLPTHREHELCRIADHVGAGAIAVAGATPAFDHPALARRIAELCDSVRLVLVAGDEPEPGTRDLRALMRPRDAPAAIRHRPDAPRPDSDSRALFLLSGGTTGLPKVITRTHEDYLYGMRHSAKVSALDADTVYLVALPAAHTFPLGCPGLLGTLLCGGRVVLAPSPRPEVAFAAIERERVSVTAAVPAVVHRWLEAYDRGRWDLTSLRRLQVGGSRLPSAQAARVEPVLGCRVQQVYGMSEGLLNFTRIDDPDEVRLRTQGRPVGPADEIRVVDASGLDVPDGATGELLVRGPGVTPGYYRAPRHNAQAFTPDGWLRTGDLVRRRPDGNLVVEGRIKDVINRGGEKICADEIEELLQEIPQIDRAAVVAVPDPELGERVCACVVLRPGAPAPTSLGEIRSMLTARGVAGYKLPERLEVVGQLPATAVGKVDKNALRGLVAHPRAAAHPDADESVRGRPM